ncbi:MAG TPA: NPCBM/NEW2 domain-containing protein [Bacteroidota bacterium]|nr:NPCBM/NEW2 domain-containing protein [Bacteroidota bacterium]
MKLFALCVSLLLAISNAPSSAAPQSGKSVWLSSLDLSRMHQGWGKAHADKSVTEKAITIAGKTYNHGVGTHAASKIWIDLHGQAARFLASVGVDDNTKERKGSVEFRIIGDGKNLWRSGIMKSGEAAKSLDVDLRDVNKLVLLVTDAGDGQDFDHADWADAQFVVSGSIPVAIDPPAEPRTVLTPQPGLQPRINGARVFGMRPGSPFLFTIPATGEKPRHYEVEKLPEGLNVDPMSGQITGTIRQAGVYETIVKVSNAHGTTSRPFKIVCGDKLALTPHMGWNSWYVWETHVSDKIMRDAADAMVKTGMVDHGYMYVNIDDCWARVPGSKDSTLGGDLRDQQGRILPNKRFPDMKSLTDYIHSKGLKAGIYISPGPTTCAGYTGSYGHEETDVKQFVDWGYDFLKYDWCSYDKVAGSRSRESLEKPYKLIGDILRDQKRDIVLNLCQYGMGNVWEWGKAVGGNSWRTAGDLGGSFEGIATALFRDGFDVYSNNKLHLYGGPGGWNDPDYLLLGYLSNWNGQTVPTPLSPNEQYTHVTLWALVAAPLIFSGDMTRLDDFTLGLLTNDEVIDVDQDPLGKPGYRVWRNEDQEVWVRELEDGSKAVGLFNRGEFEASVTAKWSDLGVTGKQRVRDLWRQQDIGVFHAEYTAKVPRHGTIFLRCFPSR